MCVSVCVCEIALKKDEIFYPTIKDQIKTLTSLAGVIVPLLIYSQLEKLLVLS